MKLEFDVQSVKVTEFGVGFDNGNGQNFVSISVDTDIQAALRDMIQATWKAMKKENSEPEKYEPSEKYESTEYLYLPLNDHMATAVRELYNAANIKIDGHALDDPAAVFCYFTRLIDQKGRHLTALRRAAQFKGVLKNRLIHLVTDALKLIDDPVFKLDADFDLIVDSANVYILRPSGFEFAGKLQQVILDAVPENIKKIRKDIAFVEFGGIEVYAKNHPRAARYLASIRGQAETKDIDKSELKKLCKETGVEVKELKGKIVIEGGYELGFLEVLDRRRYVSRLVRDKPERFKAESRKKLN